MKLSDNMTAALLMMTSMAGFTLNDAMLKMMAGQVPLYQLLFLRGLFTTVVVGIIAWRVRAFRHTVSRSDWVVISVRTLAEILAAYLFLTALFHMPLANVTAIMQALPLTLTLAAALFLKEPLGWRRLAAIAVGFVGVMLIVRPGTGGFNAFSLYGLGAVACVTLRDLVTRRLSRDVPSMLVTFVTSLAIMVVFGVASLANAWAPMAAREWGLLLTSSVFVIGGYLTSIMVMRVGEISFVAPFRYTSLIWALCLGWLLFGDWPAPIVLLGAGIVAGSGAFTLYREARLRRRMMSRPDLHRR
ncbi:DMT family transporter [Rhodobacteraceae bacterium KMM 6894]|nr:DMT family transporter [Rhodobacteraceae bacterium KMM 6894]